MGIAIISFFLLPESPEHASWLTPEEKALAVARSLSENIGSTEIVDRMHSSVVWHAMFNPTTLVNCFIFLVVRPALLLNKSLVAADLEPSFAEQHCRTRSWLLLAHNVKALAQGFKRDELTCPACYAQPPCDLPESHNDSDSAPFCTALRRRRLHDSALPLPVMENAPARIVHGDCGAIRHAGIRNLPRNERSVRSASHQSRSAKLTLTLTCSKSSSLCRYLHDRYRRLCFRSHV